MDVVIRLELCLSQAIYDVLVDDDPQSSHQKGEIDLHRNTVGVKEFISDRKLCCEVIAASYLFIFATIAQEIGEGSLYDNYRHEYDQEYGDVAHERK